MLFHLLFHPYLHALLRDTYKGLGEHPLIENYCGSTMVSYGKTKLYFNAFAFSCVPSQIFCDGNNIRWEEKLYVSAFWEQTQSFSGGCSSFGRKRNCFVNECKLSRENTILLQKNTNVSQDNAEFLRGTQQFCKKTQLFCEWVQHFSGECTTFASNCYISQRNTIYIMRMQKHWIKPKLAIYGTNNTVV